MISQEILAKIEARYCPEAITGCWLWSGQFSERDGRNPQPQIAVPKDGRWTNFSVRRGLYSHHIGRQLDASVKLTTTCGNHFCVNPEHVKPFIPGEAVSAWRQKQRNSGPAKCKYGHTIPNRLALCFICQNRGRRTAYAKHKLEMEQMRRQMYGDSEE